MTSLTQFLQENHYRLEIANNQLVGTGAAFLQEEAAASRFMVIGEEHGVGSNLRFATALFNLIQPLGYRNYVAEIGPQSALQLNKFLGEKDFLPTIQEFFIKNSFSIPFAWLLEELALMQAVAAAGSVTPLIGIDQEFVFSPQLHLETLQELCPDSSLQAALAALLKAERKANTEMIHGTPPDQLVHFMSLPLPAVWQDLREAFRSENDINALGLMEDLEASHAIYMHYKNEQYHANNDVRAQLMKKYFYRAYQQQMALNPEARFLIKLGANHVKRGHSVLGVQDIGNFISEIAVAEETHSFHLFVIPISGAQNAWLPFLPEEFKQYPIQANYGPAVKYFVEVAPYKEGWNLYDLRPLRNRQNTWSQDEPLFKDLFLGYDAVLMMADVQPATLVA